MGLRVEGFNGLELDLEKLASRLDGEDIAQRALEAGAQVIETRMVNNASTDPHPRSGKLRGAIKSRMNGKKSVTVGIWSEDVPYAYPVEFGHGGPHPAPAHPFLRPAFDEGKDEAYEQIKALLGDALHSE